MSTKKARALGINHIVLEVDDLDEALQFYSTIFEFKLRGRNEHNAFIDLGDQFIQLRVGRTQEPDVSRHFGLVVDDRKLVKKALEKMGVNLLERGLNFIDPWGNQINLWSKPDGFIEDFDSHKVLGSPDLPPHWTSEGGSEV